MLPQQLMAHGEVHERIDIVTEEIAMEPEEAMLYIKRAMLYLEDEDFDNTIQDIEKAKSIEGNEFPPALMTYAKLSYKTKSYRIALKYINKFLEFDEQHVIGLKTKANILYALKKNAESAVCLEMVIENTSTPLPENFLTLIDLYIEMEVYDKAMKIKEEAKTTLGDLMILDLKAIEIFELQKDYDGILATYDKIISTQVRKEKWLLKKAEVYLIQGKKSEANEALIQAESAISKLPARIQLTNATKNLKAEIQILKEKI